MVSRLYFAGRIGLEESGGCIILGHRAPKMPKCENERSLQSTQALKDGSSACLVWLEVENEPSWTCMRYLLADTSSHL